MSSIISFLIMIFVGITITFIFEMVLKTNKKFRKKYYKDHAVIFGYHIHHSTYGLLCFIISGVYLLYGQSAHSTNMLALGIGIIITHTISEKKFVFIERQIDV